MNCATCCVSPFSKTQEKRERLRRNILENQLSSMSERRKSPRGLVSEFGLQEPISSAPRSAHHQRAELKDPNHCPWPPSTTFVVRSLSIPPSVSGPKSNSFGLLLLL